MNHTFENVASVYSGKIGTCCCGCAGTHTRASTMKGTKEAHYVFDDAKVKRTWNKVFGGKYGAPTVEGSHAYIEIGRRLHVVYFND